MVREFGQCRGEHDRLWQLRPTLTKIDLILLRKILDPIGKLQYQPINQLNIQK